MSLPASKLLFANTRKQILNFQSTADKTEIAFACKYNNMEIIVKKKLFKPFPVFPYVIAEQLLSQDVITEKQFRIINKFTV